MDNRFERIKISEENTAAKYERGLWGDILHTLKHNKLAMGCVVVLCVIGIMDLMKEHRRISFIRRRAAHLLQDVNTV